MWSFWKNYMFHLVIEELLGFVFFPDKYENGNVSVFLWAASLAFIYLFIIFNGMVLLLALFDLNSTLRFGNLFE